MAIQIVHERPHAGGDIIEQTHSGSFMEATIRFVDWADEQRHLSYSAIAARFGVNRATAYRWLSAYRAARGQA